MERLRSKEKHREAFLEQMIQRYNEEKRMRVKAQAEKRRYKIVNLVLLMILTVITLVFCINIAEAQNCSVGPQPQPGCHELPSPPLLFRLDTNNNKIIAPDICQGKNHFLVNPYIPHFNYCLQWSEQTPVKYNGCDYVNTPFKELSLKCQIEFSDIDPSWGCPLISKTTFLAVARDSGDISSGNNAIWHWSAVCQGLANHLGIK